jgi:hypothetical protein
MIRGIIQSNNRYTTFVGHVFSLDLFFFVPAQSLSLVPMITADRIMTGWMDRWIDG